MGSADYIVKRVLFALVTVFVAVTLNFVLFRAVKGDAVSALRCRQCTAAFKEIQRKELGLDKPLISSTGSTWSTCSRGTWDGPCGPSSRS